MPPAPDRIATVAHYGPDNTRASKVVVTVLGDDDEHIAAETWMSDEKDLRHDPSTKAQILAFIAMHGVRETAVADRIIGCPHQEGIDYPLGRTCPRCPFWANIDRFTHEPLKAPRATMSPQQVLAELSRGRVRSPKAALESADAHRGALTEPLLALMEHVVAAPDAASDEEALLFTYALYLLAKWRETRAYPLVVRWLALPDEGAHELTGDVVLEDGGRILAAVCDGNLQPIVDLAGDLDADDYGRIAAIEALALLAVWAEMPRGSIVDVLQWFADEGLPRAADVGWNGLALAVASMEATELFDDIRRAADAGWIDPDSPVPDELDDIEDAPSETIEATRELSYPIDDVSEATSWWPCFAEPQAGKVGRNDPCPCGSGKKYKKCCGQ